MKKNSPEAICMIIVLCLSVLVIFNFIYIFSHPISRELSLSSPVKSKDIFYDNKYLQWIIPNEDKIFVQNISHYGPLEINTNKTMENETKKEEVLSITEEPKIKPKIETNPTDTQSPTAPSNLRIIEKGENYIKLQWDPSIDNVGVTAYEIYRNEQKIASISSEYFYDTDLKKNIEYRYFVTAVDKGKNKSEGSSVLKEKIIEKNYVTVYYKSDEKRNYMHYSLNGVWTEVPGKLMKDSSIYPGYKEITVDIGNASHIYACFNKDGHNWDNNNGYNHIIRSGKWVMDEGRTRKFSSLEKENVRENKSNNKVTIYYKSSTGRNYIHYSINGVWTDVPGKQMTDSKKYPGFKKITIDIGDASSIKACFNSNGDNWDNNNGSDYIIYAGEWMMEKD